MKKMIYILPFIVLIVLAGCETTLEHRNKTQITVTPTSQIISRPLLTRWVIVGNPTITQNGFTLAINGIGLLNQRIVVLYSLAGSNSSELVSDNNFQIIDDSGSTSKLIIVIPFSKIDRVEIGMMVFEPRRIGIRELYLAASMQSDNTVMQKTELAQLTGSISDDYPDREFWAVPTVSSVLAGDQISVVWGATPENISNGSYSAIPTESITPISKFSTTPTPASYKSSITLPKGVTVQNELFFRIQNIEKNQTQYQGVQLLSDGNVVIVSNGISMWPTPIVLVSSTPQYLYSTPYPPPSTPYP
jgi:hypothetical protein